MSIYCPQGPVSHLKWQWMFQHVCRSRLACFDPCTSLPRWTALCKCGFIVLIQPNTILLSYLLEGYLNDFDVEVILILSSFFFKYANHQKELPHFKAPLVHIKHHSCHLCFHRCSNPNGFKVQLTNLLSFEESLNALRPEVRISLIHKNPHQSLV